MPHSSHFPAQHEHVFLGRDHDRHERRTWFVVGLTAVTMVVEIVAGTVFGSMALVADGWHMSTHAAALGIAAFAYRFARQHAHDRRFSFGTGKLGDLAAFASALLLMFIALAVAWESALRLYSPIAIDFTQATVVAVLGLLVNLASAWLLSGGHDHHHGHSHGGSGGHHGHHHHDHGGHHHHAHGGGHGADTNLRAAYMHVVADAFTSILAIAALLGGRFYGWVWLDPVIGIVGACVIAHWSIGLLRASGAVLLDTVPDEALAERIGERLAAEGVEITDLHLWQVGPGHRSAIVSVVTGQPRPPADYKALLTDLPTLSHVTVEVNVRPAAA
ncbi:cation transporter [Bosea thiooxidans]|uniref:Cation transporter n=1 Tax=Bosea thiooxidans TaxID=53254 RepID=A0A0Q3SY36_9HYPH|nr:CDF family Co(II)/Ni(II) efflux transporter DmeF [Bosea thiooxidans]KQK30242.1 cation transporter [Bosea thiooxidans]